MVAVPLGPLQHLVVVGSPDYLADHGAPKLPEDLLNHDCIRQRLGSGGRFLEWEFTRNSKSRVIHVDGRLVFNEMRAALRAARNGCGLAYVFRQFAAADLGEKHLTVVLDRHTRPGEAFHLYYPSRAQMPGKLRALIDFIRAANWAVPG
jgi:DNA-binding transcriptional LysR family regulator